MSEDQLAILRGKLDQAKASARDYLDMAKAAEARDDGGKARSCHEQRGLAEQDVRKLEAEIATLEEASKVPANMEPPPAEGPMTEEGLAELEAEVRKRERGARLASAGPIVSRIQADRLAIANSRLAAAEAAFLEGRARLERQNREATDRATAAMLAANQAMADASRVAAQASSDAARWAKWAALFTLAAAAVTAAQAVWQAFR